MPIGNSVTSKYKIGTVECRIAPLNMANRLTPAHSIGLIDTAAIQVETTDTDLLGGFPQRILDSATVSQTNSITATLREFSRRNIRLMLSQGLDSNVPTDVSTSVATAAAVNATSLAVASAAGITAGSLVVVYNPNMVENVQVLRVQSVSSNTLTLDPGTPVQIPAAVGDQVYLAAQVPIGLTNAAQPYFSVQVLSTDRQTGRPVGFNFWKASISGGMNMSMGGTEFGSSDMSIKLIQPSNSDYASGGPLAHLANIIPQHPTGMYFGGADA